MAENTNQYTDFQKFMKRIEGCDILHLGHRDADCDASGSAYALSRIIPGDIGFSDGMKVSAEDLADWLNIQPIINPNPKKYDFTIIYDTPFPTLLGVGLPPHYAVIDHHTPKSVEYIKLQKKLLQGAEWHLVKPIESTCSILVELFEVNQISLSREMQIALAAGIVTDTSWLQWANADALTRVASILRLSGLFLGDIIEAIDSPERRATRREAVLAAICNVQSLQIGPWNILATSTDNHDHGFAVVSALSRLGSDISIVSFPKSSNAMVLIESNERITDSTNLDISKLATQIAFDTQAKDYWGSHVRGRVIANIPEKKLVDISIREIEKILKENTNTEGTTLS